jgi:hypothetical protein
MNPSSETAKLKGPKSPHVKVYTEWKQQYRIRSGVEATMSELKRSHGMAKLRIRRATKVRFAVACKVIACNIKRWAKALAASGSTSKDLIWFIIRRLTVFGVNINKMPLGAVAN